MKKFWNKYKEIILYLVFGGVTTAVAYGSFALCGHVFHLGVVASNIISWILAVIVAFVTNKLWVFDSKSWKLKTAARELGEFVLARLTTLVIETVILWIFVDLLHYNDLIMKLITNVIVVILNYIFSKFIIFKKKKKPEDESDPTDEEKEHAEHSDNSREAQTEERDAEGN